MTVKELLDTMKKALADERRAIQALDLDGLERASDTKDLVLRHLRALPNQERGVFLGALEQLRPELRKNLILLTHAKAYITEAQKKPIDENVEESSVRWRDGALRGGASAERAAGGSVVAIAAARSRRAH